MHDCLALDIGGTNVKFGCFDGDILSLIDQTPIRESGTADEILGVLTGLKERFPARQIAVSMPGPMDYRNGISLMVHKFAAIKGLPLKDALASPGCDVHFAHDAASFLMGEIAFGAAKGCANVIGVTLGTGLGFIRCEDGRLLLKSTLSPADSLWNSPYRGRIAEDYVSGRGIRRRWTELTGEASDVHLIAAMARAGDSRAGSIMTETGRMLGEMITAAPGSGNVEKVVVGGQIALSWDLMADGFAESCSLPASAAEHISCAALYGAYACACRGEDAFRVTCD